MKIGVNARPLVKPYTGMGQYVTYLFREMSRLYPDDEYVLVVPEKVSVDLGKNVRIVVVPEADHGTAGMKKTWWEQKAVPKFFAKEKVDVAFYTYPCNPWRKGKLPTVVTVHDAIPWKYPEYRNGILSSMYHSQTLKAVRNADLVFTVSKASKRDILKLCEVESEKVKVVYNDAGDVYKEEVDAGFREILLRKYDLWRNGYFIYCGGYDKRKNVRGLLKEYHRFAAGHEGEIVPLVLTGDRLFENALYSDLKDLLGHGGRIVQTGFINEKELAALYSSARAFVHLSREEGFNIPILEAANCGSAVVLSDIDVHKEIAGKGAIYVDPEVDGECAGVLEKLMDDSEMEKAREMANGIVGDYLWERTGTFVRYQVGQL